MFDIAVIGSGFGGLTAAALAAHSGLRVVVLEQHTRPGGCAGDFALEGFWFPAGATVITGLEPGGILHQVFDATGNTVDATPLSPSVIMHVDGVKVSYATNLHQWVSEFSMAFPDAPRGYRDFFRWSHDLGGIVYRIGASLPSFPIQSIDDVRRSLPVVRTEILRTAPLLLKTIEDVKQHFGAVGHPSADTLINGLLLDSTGAEATECSAIQGAIALDLYRRGCQWIEGGTGRLAMQLVRSIRRDGGEVRFGEQVTACSGSAGNWTVQPERGEPVSARFIIGNVPPGAFARLRGRSPQAAMPRDRDAWGAFVLHAGVDATGLDTTHPFHLVAHSGGHLADGGNAFVSIYPGRGAKADRWSVSVSTHVRAGEWNALTGCALAGRRHNLEEQLLDAAGQAIPGIRDRLLVRRSATPRTYERFTLRPGGYVGGLVQRRGNVALFAPGHRPEPGAALAGDHVFPGQGTVGVALSGINAYRDATRFLKKEAIL